MKFSFSISEVSHVDNLNNFEIFRCNVSSDKAGMYHQRTFYKFVIEESLLIKRDEP